MRVFGEDRNPDRNRDTSFFPTKNSIHRESESGSRIPPARATGQLPRRARSHIHREKIGVIHLVRISAAIRNENNLIAFGRPIERMLGVIPRRELLRSSGL